MRKLLIAGIALIALLLTGYAGYKGYKVWKQGRMVKLAQEFLGKGDIRNAMLSASEALKLNPVNLAATRLMAEINETNRSPAALLWRSRVVEINPESTDDRIALALAAARQGDFATVTNALQGVSEEGRKNTRYHNLAGTAAAGLGQVAEAEAHFQEAVRLNPTNLAPQLNLAVIRLRSTNAAVLASARASLRQIANDPDMRGQALRELIADAIRHENNKEALALSAQLAGRTNATFADKVGRLGVLHLAKSPELRPTFESCRREAATNSAALAELAAWQTGALGHAETLAWLTTLPAETQTNMPAALIMTTCRNQLKDWPGVLATAPKQNWNELDFLRHAYIARALRSQNNPTASKPAWENALKLAGTQRQALLMLLQLTGQWNWQTEGEGLLWTFISRYPNERWAFDTLAQLLYSDGRTRQLMTLFSQQVKRTPTDLSAKNNLALSALLVGAQEHKPAELAQEIYREAPTNSSYASTHAFALYTQKKYPEALAVMNQLPAADLEKPSIAGYHAVILKANGQKDAAKKYFDLAAKATLLPEERKLIEDARSR